MPSSGILCHVALVRNNVSEELRASIIRVTRICELAATLAITIYPRMLQGNTKSYLVATYGQHPKFTYSHHPDDGGASSSKTSFLPRATWHNIPEDGILRSLQCLQEHSLVAILK
jgi:hypothetical protein